LRILKSCLARQLQKAKILYVYHYDIFNKANMPYPGVFNFLADFMVSAVPVSYRTSTEYIVILFIALIRSYPKQARTVSTIHMIPKWVLSHGGHLSDLPCSCIATGSETVLDANSLNGPNR